MFKYHDPVTNRSGDALTGYYARLFDSNGTAVDIYADMSGTPISTVSGKDNAAKSDDNGMLRFYVANGIYDIRYYDSDDNYKDVEPGVPMYEASGVYDDLASDEAGKGASLVVTESGDTVEEALAALPSSAAVDAKVDLDGTANVRLITDASNPQSYGMQVQSIAEGKQVDGIYGYHENHTGGSGYVFHGVTYSATGLAEFSGGGLGGACGGPGGGSGVIGNRGDDGTGHGGIFTRLGTGPGNGVYGIAQGTGAGSAGYFLKQNPVAGVAGTGPAVYAINDSTNGQAFYARSASGNTDSNTAVIERLNVTEGTGLFTRITGTGNRTGLLIGSQTQVIPTSTSTGAFAVYGQDVQIGANVSGAETRGINLANSAVGSGESYGMAILVDGARTTSYGLFVNVANAGTNYSIYAVNGLAYFGGNANAASQYQVAGTKVVGTRKTGWATATGTATRTTFDTATVTLAQLAEHVKALIDDLHSTAGHGLIGS